MIRYEYEYIYTVHDAHIYCTIPLPYKYEHELAYFTYLVASSATVSV